MPAALQTLTYPQFYLIFSWYLHHMLHHVETLQRQTRARVSYDFQIFIFITSTLQVPTSQLSAIGSGSLGRWLRLPRQHHPCQDRASINNQGKIGKGLKK